MILIREALDRDVASIVEIWRQSVEFHGQRDPVFTQSKTGHVRFRSFLIRKMAADRAQVLIAEVDSVIAAYGICLLRRHPSYFAPAEHGFISDLDVHQAYRRQGLGQKLLLELLTWLRQHRIVRVEIEVATMNEVSKSFWNKQGFRTYYEAMWREILQS